MYEAEYSFLLPIGVRWSFFSFQEPDRVELDSRPWSVFSQLLFPFLEAVSRGEEGQSADKFDLFFFFFCMWSMADFLFLSMSIFLSFLW